MKSSETMGPCPVCSVSKSVERMNSHISQMARYERMSGLQAPKPHNEYMYSHLSHLVNHEDENTHSNNQQ